MSEVVEKFLRYVSIDTQSMEDQEQIPSTEKQRTLAKLLAEELTAMGASNVRLSSNGYVYADLPATTKKRFLPLDLFPIWTLRQPFPEQM